MSNRLPMEFRVRRSRAIELGRTTYKGRPCKHGHDGTRLVTGNCVQCLKDQLTKHRSVKNERAKKWRQDNRARSLLNEAKSRAKLKGLDFDLVLDDIMIPAVCPVLGVPMDRPSLDRRDNAKGYVRGNVFVISWRANLLKRDANIDEIARILAYMRGKPRF